MSRETQYIGLNSYALMFVKDAVGVEEYDMCEGMFGETVRGKIYHMPLPDGATKYRLEEVVQVAPWSSGPMILTCIRYVLIKESGEPMGSDGTDENDHWFKWMIDPSLKEESIEVDCRTGRYYA